MLQNSFFCAVNHAAGSTERKTVQSSRRVDINALLGYLSDVYEKSESVLLSFKSLTVLCQRWTRTRKRMHPFKNISFDLPSGARPVALQLLCPSTKVQLHMSGKRQHDRNKSIECRLASCRLKGLVLIYFLFVPN